MLLSRVAESVYWAGRYLERAETTARLVKTHTELYLALPLSVGLGWSPLLAVTGSDEAYRDQYTGAREDDIVTFLLADHDHPGSVVASIAQARHNLKVTRAILPRRTWEVVNEAHMWSNDTCDKGVSRRARLDWTEEVIRRCHLISGSMAATMCRDDAYSFLEVGRFVERADMTTRVLDVQAGILMSDRTDRIEPYADLTWMAVLRSLGAEQMFRRSFGGAVDGGEAVRFLLRDPSFPRSVEHCLIEVSRWLLELPHQEEAMAGCAAVQRRLDELGTTESFDADALHQFVDRLQEGLGSLHASLSDTYFLNASTLAGTG